MILTKHQQGTVAKLVTQTRGLLSKDGSRICVFKAPTGSGKTIMAADFLRQISSLQLPNRYAFLWISSNNLHLQSMEKLSSYLGDSRYAFILLEDVVGNCFEENQVVFVNWESLTKQDKMTGDFKNVMMRDNEMGRNLPNFLANTKKDGIEIILIVDESHYHYWSEKSQELVQNVIAPKLTIEISATPAVVPPLEDVMQGEAGYVILNQKDVIEDELIKKDTIINEAFGSYSDFLGTADEAIIDAGVAKRAALAKLFNKEKSDVNPLLLIQLPSETQETSALDISKLETIIQILKKKHGITIENKKLAIWLSDRKENLEGIERNNALLDVLIFKQAIALGWDCPRAAILIMFRDIKSHTFEVQTVGRIMRMPEVRHYDEEALNEAYVYTNLNRVEIKNDGTSEGYFRINRAVRKKGYQQIDLPSVYLSRIDYGDLTLSFRKLFMDAADERFKITAKDSQGAAKKKADISLDLLPEALKHPVIVDAIIRDLDESVKKEIFGTAEVKFTVSPNEIKRAYEEFARAVSAPFALVRSYTKIQQAIYDWFDKRLGYEKVSRLEIQRIVVCSETNQLIFREIIEKAKERFKEVDKKEKQSKQRKKNYLWNVPEDDYFNDQSELVEAKKAILVSGKDPSKTLLLKDRSIPERAFEEILERSKSVVWWYKNGVSVESYFAIAYVDPITEFERAFYPDYIVQFTNGSIGIYDPKDGMTVTSPETAAKSDALQAYLIKNKGKNLTGGIVSKITAGFFVCTASHYSPDITNWMRLEL